MPPKTIWRRCQREDVNNKGELKGGEARVTWEFLETYPPDPLPLTREGGIIVPEGADAPSDFPFTISYQKGVQEG